VTIVFLLLVAATLLAPATAAAVELKAKEQELFDLINAERSAHGVPEVRIVPVLYRSARQHSRSMIRYDYFSHDSWNGDSFAERIRAAGYSKKGYSSWRVGEVLAYGKGLPGTPQSVIDSWMDSSAHRKVLLRSGWRDCGVGRVYGTYNGVEGVAMYTVDFGHRIK